MSLKFQKNRSVPFAYHAVPMYYTGIHHPENKDKEAKEKIKEQLGKEFEVESITKYDLIS